jgi:hypothetical protein
MITKCKQTAENSCSLFYKQKKTAIPRDWPSDFASPYHFSTYVIVFFFNTRSKNEQCTENLHFCGQREKKFHPKQKICSSKLGILYKKPSPSPFYSYVFPSLRMISVF